MKQTKSLLIAGAATVTVLAGALTLSGTNTATRTAQAEPLTGASATMSTVEVVDCSQTTIQQLVDSVSQANVEANLRALVQDDTKPVPNQLISRHVSSPGNKQKTDWMNQQLASYGLATRSQSFKSGKYYLTNTIGRLNGSTAGLYTVGAHIDSMSEMPGVLAPGADDNASGVAAVMEAARVLKPFESCLNSSVDFIGFNDEEVGMKGSATYASSVNKTTYKGLYNLDMVGYPAFGECIKSYYRSASREQALAQRIADVNGRYNIGLAPVTVKQYLYNDIDAAMLWKYGLPATFQYECVADGSMSTLPGYHTSRDTLEYVSVPMVTKVTKAIVAATAELASQ